MSVRDGQRVGAVRGGVTNDLADFLHRVDDFHTVGVLRQVGEGVRPLVALAGQGRNLVGHSFTVGVELHSNLFGADAVLVVAVDPLLGDLDFGRVGLVGVGDGQAILAVPGNVASHRADFLHSVDDLLTVSVLGQIGEGVCPLVAGTSQGSSLALDGHAVSQQLHSNLFRTDTVLVVAINPLLGHGDLRFLGLMGVGDGQRVLAVRSGVADHLADLLHRVGDLGLGASHVLGQVGEGVGPLVAGAGQGGNPVSHSHAVRVELHGDLLGADAVLVVAVDPLLGHLDLGGFHLGLGVGEGEQVVQVNGGVRAGSAFKHDGGIAVAACAGFLLGQLNLFDAVEGHRLGLGNDVVLVAIGRFHNGEDVAADGHGEQVARLIVHDARLGTRGLKDHVIELAVFGEGNTVCKVDQTVGVVGRRGHEGNAVTLRVDIGEIQFVGLTVAVQVLNEVEAESAGLEAEAGGRLGAGNTQAVADGGVVLMADDQIAVAQDAAAMGVGLIAGNEHLGCPERSVPVGLVGMVGQAGDGNANEHVILADRTLMDGFAVDGAAPVRSAVAQHTATDVAGQSAEVVLIMRAIIAVEHRIVIGIDAVNVLGGLGTGHMLARSGVVKDRRAVRHIVAGVMGIDSAGGAACDAAAVTARFVVDDEHGLHVHIAVVADEDTAAAPVLGGLGLVVGDVAAGDLAITAVVDDDTAALILVGKVAGDMAAGHEEVAALVPVAVDDGLDTAAALGLVGGHIAAVHDELTQHAHAAAAAPAAVVRLRGGDPVVGDVAVLHGHGGVGVDVDRAAAGTGPGLVAGEDNAMRKEAIGGFLNGQLAAAHVDSAAVPIAEVGEDHVVIHGHVAQGVNGAGAVSAVENAALDVQLAVRANVEDAALRAGRIHKADLVQLDAVMQACLLGAGIRIAAGGDHVALGDVIVEIIAVDIRGLAEVLAGVLLIVADNLRTRLDGQLAALHIKEGVFRGGDSVGVHLDGGVRRDGRGAFALGDIADQVDLHAGQAQIAGGLEQLPAIGVAGDGAAAGDGITVADDLGKGEAIGRDGNIPPEVDIAGEVDIVHLIVGQSLAQLLLGTHVEGDLAVLAVGQGVAVLVDLVQAVHVDLLGQLHVGNQLHAVDVGAAQAVRDLPGLVDFHNQAAAGASVDGVAVHLQAREDAVINHQLLVQLDVARHVDGRRTQAEGRNQLFLRVHIVNADLNAPDRGIRRDRIAIEVQLGQILDGQAFGRADVRRQLHGRDAVIRQGGLQAGEVARLRSEGDPSAQRQGIAVFVDHLTVLEHEAAVQRDVRRQADLRALRVSRRVGELRLIVNDVHQIRALAQLERRAFPCSRRDAVVVERDGDRLPAIAARLRHILRDDVRRQNDGGAIPRHRIGKACPVGDLRIRQYARPRHDQNKGHSQCPQQQLPKARIPHTLSLGFFPKSGFHIFTGNMCRPVTLYYTTT